MADINEKDLEKIAGGVDDFRYANVDDTLCISCGACVVACPTDSITIEDTAHVDIENCVACGNCIDKCPMAAISIR